MLQIFALVAFVLALNNYSELCCSQTIDERKPNVIMVVVDDLGWADLGCYGSSFYETPNLDALAHRGIRLTNSYATCPVCSPTRCSLLTGKYPQRLGITDYCGAPQPEMWDRKTRLLPAPYQEYLDLEETSLAERLKAKGYSTLFAGKWHLGPEGYWPEDQGFELNYGGTDRGGPYGGNKYFSPYRNPRLTDGPNGEHLPDRLAQETVKFIAEHRDQPFLAYVCFYSVHTPLMSRPDLQEKYEQKKLNLEPAVQPWGQEGDSRVRLVQDHPVYAGMIEAMDLAVGKILTAVQENQLQDDTIVIFTSDNGGLSTSEGHPTSNLPMRAGKGWLYEGGIRIPTIVYVPTKVLSVDRTVGTTVDQYINSADFVPTIIELVGGKIDEATPVDGKSFVPCLKSEPFDRGPIFWHYPHYGNQGGSPSAAIRNGRWKLIEWFETGKLELFDLELDQGETKDLANGDPVRVREMVTLLHQWQSDVGAKYPVERPINQLPSPPSK